LVIIGPGRLGRSCSALLKQKSIEHSLIGRDQQIPPADLYWLTVPDRVIAEAALDLPEGGVILHASGVMDHLCLRPRQPAGVLHPLMSFPGPEISLPAQPIPASVSGDPEAVEAARMLGDLLGFDCFCFEGDRRLYHAAAVMAGNYATGLLHMAAQLLVHAGMDPKHAREVLYPLARRSLDNAVEFDLQEALTGPISRGDSESIQAHIEAMTPLPDHLRQTYISMHDGILSQLQLLRDRQ
jgi:predicted short-subunit dehydrogenase-like oxidoreductase (DUF2520 family)